MWPSRPALALGARVVHDYAALASRVARQAAAMRASGLEAGDRVALVARNHPATSRRCSACWWRGSSRSR
jgi:acyl-CoA synthetase (AMP-forming)/AMP-acid ligase II